MSDAVLPDENVAHPDNVGELRRVFHQQLDDLRERIAKLAARVTESIPRATEILLTQDLEGAELMVLADDEIDAKALEFDDACFEMLALQSPVAGDLRRIIAAMRIIAEIERSADLTVNICKAARRIYGHQLDPRLRGIVHRMGDQAHKLFKEATEAYLTDDVARAAALDDMDSYLDDLQREFVQAIFTSHSTEKLELQVAVQLAIVARFYERIGDHAVNVGERVRFLVTGSSPDYPGAARYAERQAASDLE
jgi:phosphate transport system protein